MWTIARVDLLRRVRRPGFLWFIAALLLIGYYLVPSPTAGYATLTYQGARGIYNSGHIGATVAVLTSLLVSLVGFYLIVGTISNDRHTGLGYIVASTPVTRLTYVYGKLMGSFLYLLTFPAILWIASIAMHLWRGERNPQLFILTWPFLLLPTVTAAVVAGIAVLFENIRWLTGTLGLVIYFFLWLAGLTLPLASRGEAAPYLDLSGIAIVTESLVHFFGNMASMTNSGITVGVVTGKTIGTFDWPGIAINMAIVWPRLAWAAFGLGLGILSAGLFDRFDPARERRRPARPPASPFSLVVSNETTRSSSPGVLSPHLFPGEMVPVDRSRQLKGLWQAEMRLTLKKQRWFLPVSGLITLLAFLLPTHAVQHIGLPLALILPIGLLSDLACREIQANTFRMVATVPTAPQIYPLWKGGVGITIMLMVTVGPLVRFLLVGAWPTSLAVFGGIVFVVAWAIVAGALTHNHKTFIASYTFFWFLIVSNAVPPWLDYAGIHYAGQDARISLAYLGLAMTVIVFSTWARLCCQQSRWAA